MLELITYYLMVAAALGSGLMAGLFFAFSAFVLHALARLPAAQGISAMQSINVTVLNRLFLSVFVGTALASCLLTVIALFNWQNSLSIYIVVGSLLYLLGTFLVTVVCNVPLNHALAAVDGNNEEGVAFWRYFLSKWMVWNHIRTGSSLAALTAFILALST
ncbi:anthrone oxygenase family protein [Gracilibacillus alcaliphilus]|uniref:anthrone oxygenase family protein n=1 Tax=Gracilibacillus alcaliphilus TaxID=1401441 RepID=UPI001958D419|nr:anthrone oxygenase family protein [Gracilibacillus alcaliphilus]